MDDATRMLVFVHQFCSRLAQAAKGMRDMHSWYLWSDKRSGSITERFDQDARDWAEYQKMFQV